MSILYVVATPIGNLEDVTLRALRVLGEASLIAAEDTRTTSKLLAHPRLRPPLPPPPGPPAAPPPPPAPAPPPRQFTYLGFLPRRAGERRRLFASFRDDPRTIVAFESPHRLARSLSDMRSELGDRRIAGCRELTKAVGEGVRGRSRKG